MRIYLNNVFLDNSNFMISHRPVEAKWLVFDKVDLIMVNCGKSKPNVTKWGQSKMNQTNARLHKAFDIKNSTYKILFLNKDSLKMNYLQT